jgi:toxin-antitoxin system PIN domain toxin
VRALFDVNVLIALFDLDHSLHQRAFNWFAQHGDRGWATCPVTQNGCLRVMATPSYSNARPIVETARRLKDAFDGGKHEFWPDDISLVDRGIVDLSRVHGPRQLTDVYLLALAVAKGGRLVTFDAAVSRAAVANASPDQLVVL